MRRACLIAALALAGCASSPTIVPVTPLTETPLSLRPADREAGRKIADLEIRQDWAGLSQLALEELARRPGDPDWLVVHGYARLRAGDRPGSIEALRQAASRSPEDGDASNLLGEALRLSGQPGEAIRVLERSLLARPNSPQGWSVLGDAYSDDSRLERAKAAYAESLRLDPGYALAWYGLAGVLARTGPAEEYAQAAGQLQKLNPSLYERHLETTRRSSEPLR